MMSRDLFRLRGRVVIPSTNKTRMGTSHSVGLPGLSVSVDLFLCLSASLCLCLSLLFLVPHAVSPVPQASAEFRPIAKNVSFASSADQAKHLWYA